MATSAHPPVTRILDDTWERSIHEPAFGAYVLLRIGYVVLPLWMGIDKFTKVLQPDWPHYLAPWVVNVIPFSAQTAMYVVGAIEILAADVDNVVNHGPSWFRRLTGVKHRATEAARYVVDQSARAGGDHPAKRRRVAG